MKKQKDGVSKFVLERFDADTWRIEVTGHKDNAPLNAYALISFGAAATIARAINESVDLLEAANELSWTKIKSN